MEAEAEPFGHGVTCLELIKKHGKKIAAAWKKMKAQGKEPEPLYW